MTGLVGPEYLEIMKALWTQDDPVYQGQTFSISGVRFNPKPVQKPHPPIVVGGTSDSALKRSVRYGDGWYGIARSLDEARNLIARLRGFERSANRARPVEITLSLRTGHPLTTDEVGQLRDLGVDRTLAGLPLRALEGDEVGRFRDEIMAKA
jgi:alkanesulfonate monooxygenase SsuD/methylene tetrahydromethanopterin reductase-like flavin-dependent oxidoreductase (luciferase family)